MPKTSGSRWFLLPVSEVSFYPTQSTNRCNVHRPMTPLLSITFFAYSFAYFSCVADVRCVKEVQLYSLQPVCNVMVQWSGTWRVRTGTVRERPRRRRWRHLPCRPVSYRLHLDPRRNLVNVPHAYSTARLPRTSAELPQVRSAVRQPRRPLRHHHVR